MIRIIVIGESISPATVDAISRRSGQDVLVIPFENAFAEFSKQIPETPKLQDIFKIPLVELPAKSGRERRRWRRGNERRRQ